MNILVTGCAGFVGSTICLEIRRNRPDWKVFGIDNLSRVGSEVNVSRLCDAGVTFYRGDVRCETDFESFRDIDYVIDAAANPSVLAGTSGSSPRQVIDQNLIGTINTLEFCRRSRCGFILLSSSRVYSIFDLRDLQLVEGKSRYIYATDVPGNGCSSEGISELFPTKPPISIYGVTKLASEYLAMEYSASYGFPVWIDRCGVLSGEGQFGVASQGIISFWIGMLHAGLPLKYTGQGGRGFQVRDVLHPVDLCRLLLKQVETKQSTCEVFNVSGGISSSFSLYELTEYCHRRGFGNEVQSQMDDRLYDVPHVVLDSRNVNAQFDWYPIISRDEIFDRVIEFTVAHPEWLLTSGNRHLCQ